MKPENYLCKTDEIFDQIIKKYGHPKITIRPQGFETLVLLILEQQVSISSANATFQKIKTQIGQIQPQKMLQTTNEDFRSCGVSRQKTTYIKCLSTAIEDKTLDLENLSNLSANQVRAELIKIKGIGNWTIDVYLMFALQFPDIIPLGDIAIINTIKQLWNIHEKSAMETLTKKWAPHRSYATFLLWHHYLESRKQ